METEQNTHGVSEGSTAKRSGSIAKVVRALIKRRPRAVLILLLIVVGLAAFTFTSLYNVSPEQKAQKELAAAVAAVSKLMILPEGDEPVLATVTDAAALTAQQAFFTGSVDGDQLLLFPKSLKAIIYSPSRGKIINAGPIEQSPTTNGATEQSSAPSSSADTLTVEVRNGSGKAGYGAQFAQELGGSAGYKVVKVDDAGKDDYKSTVVYMRTADKDKQSKAGVLATSLGATAIESLPDGEKATSADVLVILGGSQ